jgi:hypothetical protein
MSTVLEVVAGVVSPAKVDGDEPEKGGVGGKDVRVIHHSLDSIGDRAVHANEDVASIVRLLRTARLPQTGVNIGHARR